MSPAADLVHHAIDALQPLVRFGCEKEPRRPDAEQPSGAHGLFSADAKLYTFDYHKATCPACITRGSFA